MKTKHTSGEWNYKKADNLLYVVNAGPENKIMAEIYPVDYSYEGEPNEDIELVMEANAKLISAAPDLLLACIWVKEQFEILADKGLYPEHLMAENGGDGIMPLVHAIKKATE